MPDVLRMEHRDAANVLRLNQRLLVFTFVSGQHAYRMAVWDGPAWITMPTYGRAVNDPDTELTAEHGTRRRPGRGRDGVRGAARRRRFSFGPLARGSRAEG